MLETSVVNTALAKLLVDKAHLFLFSYSTTHQRLISWSPNAEEVLGVTDEDIISNKNILFRFIHHRDLMRVMGGFNTAQKDKTEYQTSYTWRVSSQAAEKQLHLRGGFNYLDDDLLFEGVIIDVSTLDGFIKKTSQRFVTSSNTLDSSEIERRTIQTVLAAIPAKVVVLNASRVITCVSSPNNLDSFDFGDSAFQYNKLVMGNHFLDCFESSLQKDLFQKNIEEILNREIDFKIIRITSNNRIFSLTFSALTDHISVNGIILLISDITTSVSIEKIFLQQEHAQNVRLLASGVAHNINNCLQAITSQATLIEALSEDNEIRNSAVAIQESVVKAAKTIKKLVNLNPKTQDDYSLVDLNSVVFKAINNKKELLSSKDRAGVKLTISFGTPPLIYCLETELVFIIEELIQNAQEATTRGTISLVTDEITLQDNQIENLSAGDYAVLKVRDTGCGMTEKRKNQCTTPFFTTKNLDPLSNLGLSGEGLGLSKVEAILHSIGGVLTIETQENMGTTVQVLIPKGK